MHRRVYTTYIHTHIHIRVHVHTRPLARSYTHPPTHTRTYGCSLSRARWCAPAHLQARALPFTHTLSDTPSHTIRISHSHTHTITHRAGHLRTYTHKLFLSYTLSRSHTSHTLTLSHTYNHTRAGPGGPRNGGRGRGGRDRRRRGRGGGGWWPGGSGRASECGLSLIQKKKRATHTYRTGSGV